jgi:hypothetical protein
MIFSRYAITMLWSFAWGSAVWVFVVALSRPTLPWAVAAAAVPILSAAIWTRRVRREAARVDAALSDARAPDQGVLGH